MDATVPAKSLALLSFVPAPVNLLRMTRAFLLLLLLGLFAEGREFRTDDSHHQRAGDRDVVRTPDLKNINAVPNVFAFDLLEFASPH